MKVIGKTKEYFLRGLSPTTNTWRIYSFTVSISYGILAGIAILAAIFVGWAFLLFAVLISFLWFAEIVMTGIDDLKLLKYRSNSR